MGRNPDRLAVAVRRVSIEQRFGEVLESNELEIVQRRCRSPRERDKCQSRGSDFRTNGASRNNHLHPRRACLADKRIRHGKRRQGAVCLVIGKVDGYGPIGLDRQRTDLRALVAERNRRAALRYQLARERRARDLNEAVRPRHQLAVVFGRITGEEKVNGVPIALGLEVRIVVRDIGPRSDRRLECARHAQIVVVRCTVGRRINTERIARRSRHRHRTGEPTDLGIRNRIPLLQRTIFQEQTVVSPHHLFVVELDGQSDGPVLRT